MNKSYQALSKVYKKTRLLFVLVLILVFTFPTAYPALSSNENQTETGWEIYLPAVLSTAIESNDPGTQTVVVTGTSYYVDCNGNDSNAGTSPAQAWRTVGKANNANLLPGDGLFFKRGCTWTGALEAKWNGTPTHQILISAYGSGNLPKFQNSQSDLSDKHHNSVNITGSYQTIEYLEVTIVNPPVDPGCNNQPVGFYVGFNFDNSNDTPTGGSYNTLRFSKATKHTVGVHTARYTHHNLIMHNTLTNNNVMNILTPKSVNASDDLGAWGILLKGNNHDVGYNYLANNYGICAYDTGPQGNAIELYEAQNNIIDHNVSINDQTFSELGGSAQIATINNHYVHNLVISSRQYTRFVVVRGSGSQYGPNTGTVLDQNTVYYTGSESQGIVCGAGCNSKILNAQNNIIWAEEKAAFADAPFYESNNIYWSTNGAPIVQFMGFNISPTSKIANPRFVSISNEDFHLLGSSPAINAGANLNWLKKDLDGTLLPQSSNYDIGAYEYKP